jgi:hypothetical protein
MNKFFHRIISTALFPLILCDVGMTSIYAVNTEPQTSYIQEKSPMQTIDGKLYSVNSLVNMYGYTTPGLLLGSVYQDFTLTGAVREFLRFPTSYNTLLG